MMNHGPLNEYEHRKLCNLLRSFSQAYRLNGVFHMKFGTRRMPDSDSESIIDVYLTPQDDTAAATATSLQSQHMQFLDSMVPATISGYQYIVKIDDGGPELSIEVLEALPPVSS